jgi:hypothetical protein
MRFAPNIFDVWVFRPRAEGVEFLLLYTALQKATRYFNGGRFWQIPSNLVKDGESITDAIGRVLAGYGLRPKRIWAGEHAYIIYNRRFDEMQAIGVTPLKSSTLTSVSSPRSTRSMRGFHMTRASSASIIAA